MPTDGERVAVLETILDDLRGDVAELTRETQRTRKRLHDLEGTARGLVYQEKVRREATAERQKRLEIRMQVLTAVVAIAAVVTPFLYHAAGVG